VASSTHPTSPQHWVFTALSTQVYLIMYVLMFIAAVKLRRSQPDHARGLPLPVPVVDVCPA
jgi:glutamate:GABA antiporter